MILAADIGGTNCRLGMFRHDNSCLSQEKTVWISTVNLAHTQGFIEAMENELGCAPSDAELVVAAMAGPVQDNRGRLSNGNLELDFTLFQQEQPKFRIINDFMAQAWAVASPHGLTSQLIWGHPAHSADSPRAVLGAGTGLGQALLPPMPHGSGQWQPLPSEFGHSAFPFISKDEIKFHDFVRSRLGLAYATGDDIVTGRGLTLLHEFLTGALLPPQEIGHSALGTDTETLIWYSRFYARACRNWILTTLCSGGLWIAGGIAARNPYCVQNKYFRHELLAAPKWRQFLAEVPVYLITDKNSGLWGCAFLGQQMLHDFSR